MSLGDRFGARQTITEGHITTGAGLIGDFNPVHVDETFAKTTVYGSRILHGVITSAIMAGPVGNYFHGTAVAYLEHNCKFLAPVRAGDTIETIWTVAELTANSKHRGGVIGLTGICRNQHDDIVARATGRILVKSKETA